MTDQGPGPATSRTGTSAGTSVPATVAPAGAPPRPGSSTRPVGRPADPDRLGAGDFDDLPGAGKPMKDLGTDHDPDWWVKRLVEREQISVLPPALRAAQGGRGAGRAAGPHQRRVRGARGGRVLQRPRPPARCSCSGGPPVITPERDVDAEVEAWRERRTARIAAQRAALAAQQPEPRPAPVVRPPALSPSASGIRHTGW